MKTSTPTQQELISALKKMKQYAEQLAETVNYFSPGKVRAEDFTEPADLILKRIK
jgi:hypothetical protein